MPSIDERVVSMAFENAVFEQRVTVTLTTLGKLDTALKNMGNTSGFDKIEAQANKVTLNGPMSALDKLKSKLGGAGQGASEGLNEIERAGNKVTLEGPNQAVDKLQGKMGQLSAGSTFTDIEKAASRVTLEGLTRALDNVTSKFSVLEGAASVAMGNIASQAAMKGGNFAKSFAFGPAKQGFEEYQTNLGSIQTILANTQGQQVSGLGQVQKHLNELNTYSDKTIYNFSEMAKNIGTFTAAGVDMDTSTAAIKGIANLAAVSGSNSQQASTAMYQLSQAIASGKVGLQDWNSVVNAGMGGAVFQKSLMRTAENMGAIEKGAVKIDKATGKATVNGESFRDSISGPGPHWLTSDVLTETLKQMTGDMSDAQLKAKGFTDEQVKAIQAQATMAQKAATEVKTLPQVFDVARETIGSGWAQTFTLIFGNFNESKKTFTELSNFINGIINRMSAARNKVLGEWSKLGGRMELISGIKELFVNVRGWVLPVIRAFKEIFPPTTGKQLFEFTKGFNDFAHSLNTTDDFADNIQRTFKGFFAVLHIGWTIIKDVASVLGDLLGAVGHGSGGFVSFTAGIGDFLVALDKAITSGDGLKKFFKSIGTVIAAPVKLIISAAKAFASLFGGGDTQKISERNAQLLEFGKVLTPAERLVWRLKVAWETLVDRFEKTKKALEPWFSSFVDKLKGFGKAIGDAMSHLSLDDILKGVQTGLLAGLFVTLRQMFGKGGGFLDQLKKTLGSVNELVGGFTGQMEAMQSKLKAEALLAIAGAVAVLAAGIYILSTIDGDKLAKAMSAVAIGLGELMGAMKLMTSGMGKLGMLQLPVIAAGMIGLATAVLILSAAMKVFSTMSWEDIGKGLIGVAGSLTAVALAMKLMPPTLPLTAAGLILIGVALNLIAASMKTFGSMKLEEIAKGIFAMVEALAGIALGVSMMPPNLPLTAASLILMGIALGFIGSAIKKMGQLDFLTILKGLGTMMAAIAGIGLAMSLMPPNMALSAAGVFIVANAMVVLGAAMKIMGSMGVDEIVKSLIAMGGALLVLGVGLIFMSGTLGGAVALMAAAVALAILGPAIAFLGTLKFSTILKGLAAIALALGTLALVGALVAEPLAMLGIALIPLAAVFVLTAGAVFLFAKAMSLLGSEGGKGIAVMVTAITAFVALIPTIVVGLVKGLLSTVEQLAALAPKVVTALGVIIDTIIAFVIASAPKLAIAIGVLVDSIIQVLVTNTPKLISAGAKILMDLLNGISQNIGKIVDKVSEIIIKFNNALAAQAPQLVSSGMKVLTNFLQGITNNIPKVVTTVANMVIKFIDALSQNVPRIIGAGQDMMIKFLAAIAGFVPKLVSKGVDIVLSFISGIAQNINKVISKGADLIIKFIEGIGSNMNKIANKGADAVIKFLNGLADTIRTKGPELRKAGWNVADALLDGIWNGIAELGQKVVDKLGWLVKLLPDKVKKLLGIKSPSSVFMGLGRFTMMGFQKGIEDSAPAVHKSGLAVFGDTSTGFIGGIRSILGIHSPSEVMREIGQEVNRGFAKGLEGSADDIRSAFQSLNDKLKDNIRTAKETIVSEQGKLDDELKKKKPDWEVVKAAQDAIGENEKLLARSRAGRAELVKGLSDEKGRLIGLKKDYDALTQQLTDAQAALEKITNDRADFQKQQAEQFSATPDISQLMSTALADAELTDIERVEKAKQAAADAEKRRKIDQVRLYQQALANQVKANIAYNATLEKLKALKLDDTTYRKLVEQGTAGQEFADQLLQGGQPAVDSINALDAKVAESATTLANNAAANLYDAGVKTAKGFVDGFKSDLKDLEKTMEELADRMVAAIKRKLKIKSPSLIFAEIGQFATKGLAQGLTASSKAVSDAAGQLGSDAVSAVQNTINGISSAISDNIDVEPTITPVLDLTGVKQGAKQLDDLTNVTPITAAASYGQASATSQEFSAAQQAAAAAAGTTPTFRFEQNNYSPESLSDVEIYRQTKNQLGQIKSALGLVS